MKSHRLRTPYVVSSIFIVILFYSLPYLMLSGVRGLELAVFWSLITLVWLAVTNLLLMRDLL